MTNDKPPVAPKEGHYAMLRNGNVMRHFSPCEYNPEIYRTPMGDNCFWHSDGRAFVEHRPNKKEPWPNADIIATISPEAMNEAVALSQQPSQEELSKGRVVSRFEWQPTKDEPLTATDEARRLIVKGTTR
jgi:hypothetical protein